MRKGAIMSQRLENRYCLYDFFHYFCPSESVYNPQNEMFAPRKTKRSLLKNETLLKSPFSKNFRPGEAGGWGCPGSVFEWPPNTVRRPFFFALGRCATALSLSLYAHAASLNALYAATLCALTINPRKARREPTTVLAYEASLFAFAHDTPPLAFALL